MTFPVRPGAEPLSHEGSDVGVLVLHGFTGSPATMRPLADALVAAGFSVEMPRLPGHGTDVEDMVQTVFDDYAAAAETAYSALAARTSKVVVAGLSMGGTLTAWITARYPEVAGAVFVNAAVAPMDPALGQMVKEMIAAGETVASGVGSDIADPDATEDAYEGSPLAPLLSLMVALDALQPKLADITCPVLIMTSPNDHVVDPSSGDHLAERVSGPVERVTLERSYHVATLDFDKQLVADRAIDFVRKVTAG